MKLVQTVSKKLNFKVPPTKRENFSPSDVEALTKEIKEMLRDVGAVLVAHYYTDEHIQVLAEETGGIVSDSLDMARFGHESESKIIVVAGVRFMGETAKILNPEKTVLMPSLRADCSLDLGCPAEEFGSFCAAHPDRTVVVYANTSAAVKAQADWMVTSGSAIEVVKYLSEKGEKVLWAPDRYLGDYVQRQTGADMLMWNGSCIVHEEFKAKELHDLRSSKPKAKVIAHPESPWNVLSQADFVGSTTGLINFVKETDAREVIVATDKGIFHKMNLVARGKKIIPAPTAGESATCQSCAECPWMAMNSLTRLREALRKLQPEITVDSEVAKRAIAPIGRLLGFAKSRQAVIFGNNDA